MALSTYRQSVPLSFGGLNELTFPVLSDRNVNGGKKSIENVRGMFPGISEMRGRGGCTVEGKQRRCYPTSYGEDLRYRGVPN